MLITDKAQLKKFAADQCLWLGIPSIEVTKGGKTYLTFYSGGVKEEFGNYVILVRSEDGKTFGEPIAVCYEEGYRCFDPCLWIDPLGRLWFTWSRCPEDAVFGAICDDPDAQELVFGEEFFMGHNVLMNKPTVLSDGQWLFPIAVWNWNVRTLSAEFDSDITPKGAFAYSTTDQGKTFQKLGYADVKKRSFDEHMFLELQDGTLRCFVRTNYGIGAADSYDGGKHWGKDFRTDYGGPSSRFHIRRLPSGRVLLINHYNFKGRNNLHAMLSEDDGKTFPYKLLLDERSNIAYPDAALDENGRIHITYDRERGAFWDSYDQIMAQAREILTACITEEDILTGKLVSPGSFLKNVAWKLTDYKGSQTNPFNEIKRFSISDCADYVAGRETDPQEVLHLVMEGHLENAINLQDVAAIRLDQLADAYVQKPQKETLVQIIELIRYAPVTGERCGQALMDQLCGLLAKAPSLDANEAGKRLNVSGQFLRCMLRLKAGMVYEDLAKSHRVTCEKRKG